MSTQSSAPTPALRSRLFAVWPAGKSPAASELLRIARAGFRGLHVQPEMRLGQAAPAAAAWHIALLREAAGVGLRVYWSGHLEGVDAELLLHLDPPRDEGGRPRWPVPRAPQLTIRRGPGFALVEDARRQPGARSVVDDPQDLAALDETRVPRRADLLPVSSLRRLLGARLVAPVGPVLVALPVRFTIAREPARRAPAEEENDVQRAPGHR